jgi:hypothetical protein
MYIHELTNPIVVETPLGKGKAIAWIDYGSEVNTVWKVVLYQNGMVRNFYDTEVLVYPNKLDGGNIDKTYFTQKTNSL